MPDEKEELRRHLAEAKETIRVQRDTIASLESEKQDLRKQLEVLQRERPKLSPESLMDSFSTALTRMQEGLETGEGRVGYVLRAFDTDLKTAVSVDEEGKLNFVLPSVEDVIPKENLSTIRFSLASIPRVPAPPAETAQIPNLTGMTRDAAEKAVEAAGFVVGQTEERASMMAPGTVIEQDPEPYAHAEVGVAIDLVISRARETTVPEVIGMERDAAIEVIESSRLTVGQVTEEVSDSPPGTVIGQGIPGGTVVPLGTAVDLTIAKPEMTRIPNLVGAPLGRAQKALEEARLRVGDVTERVSDEPRGVVLLQRPAAREQVPVNSRVHLVVAKPRTVKVPGVKGLERETALAAIEEAGLAVGKVIHEASDERPGTVIRQDPKPGTEVQPGAALTLVVSRAERLIVPDLTGLSLDEAERVVAQHDLTVGRVIRRRSREPAETVIGQKPDGGTEVRAGTKIQLTVPIR